MSLASVDRLRLRFSDDVPLAQPQYRKSWVTAPPECRTIADLMEHIKNCHTYTHTNFHFFLQLQGYAILPEEQLSRFIKPGDILEVRCQSSVVDSCIGTGESSPSASFLSVQLPTTPATKKRRHKRKRSDCKPTESNLETIDGDASATMEHNLFSEPCIGTGESSPSASFLSVQLPTTPAVKKRRHKRKRSDCKPTESILHVDRYSEASDRPNQLNPFNLETIDGVPSVISQQRLFETTTTAAKNMSFQIDNCIESNYKINNGHIRFDSSVDEAVAAIDSAGSVDIHASSNDSDEVLPKNMSKSNPVMRNPSWIQERLRRPSSSLGNFENVHMSSHAQKNKEVDEEINSYDPRFMGLEENPPHDFRKKPYSVLSSVHRQLPVDTANFNSENNSNHFYISNSSMIEAGDIIFFRRIELCEETWQITTSAVHEAQILAIRGDSDRNRELVLKLLHDEIENGFFDSSVTLMFSSMTDIYLLRGPSFEKLVESAKGKRSPGSCCLDLFVKDLQSKRRSLT